MHDWLLRYIRRCQVPEALTWIVEQIYLDKLDGHEYTLDEAGMAKLREAVRLQKAHLEQEQ